MGKNSLRNSQAGIELFKTLQNSTFEVYDNITPNPQLSDINTISKQINHQHPTLIIAIGGGSVIDTAKAALAHKPLKRRPEFLAIPTTAGTGSESTQFATYYDGKVKKSFDNPMLLPTMVILSHEFTQHLPKTIAAETGADALCQVIESYWNITSTAESRLLAQESITLILKSIKSAVQDNDKSARQDMLHASNLAGRAINITRTTAAHSISYPITSYFGIPHGQAVSITLPHILAYNYEINEKECQDKRGVRFVVETLNEINHLLGADNSTKAKEVLLNLFEGIGLKTKLSDLIPNRESIEVIIKNGFTPERIKNNPRYISQNSMRELLTKIF